MLHPVARRLIVAMSIILTSAVAFSHDQKSLFEPEDKSDDDLGPYSLDDSASDDVDPSSKHQETSDKWLPNGVFGNVKETVAQPSIMDTFEKFKRQAVKTVVPGDEAVSLTEGSSSFSRFNSLVSWQTATLISVLCVGAVIVGVVLGVLYWPNRPQYIEDGRRLDTFTQACCAKKFPEESCNRAGLFRMEEVFATAFGERRDSSVESKKDLIVSSIERAGDRSLAHSAQMYHYQQQKQQMLAMEQAAGRVRNLDSNSDSEGECEEPDVNVYECPGLASAGEMEVKNPLFQEHQGESSGVSLAKDSK